jgi:hypothetical protein
MGPYNRSDLESWYYEGTVDGSVMVHHPEMEVGRVSFLFFVTKINLTIFFFFKCYLYRIG